MKRLLVVFVLSLLAVPPTVAGRQTDKDRAVLIGPVQTVATASLTKGSDGWREGQRTVTTYDSKGSETETAFYNSSNAGGSLYEKAVHIYDAQGKRTETDSYGPDGSLISTTVYAYADKGNLTEETSSNTLGFIGKTVYAYDDKENLTEEDVYGSSGIKYQSFHTYDEHGRRSATTTDDAHGPGLGIEKVVTTYDINGNVIEETTYYTHKVGDEEDRPIPSPAKMVYTYEFDAHGNWIKQTQSLCTSKSESTKPVCEPSLVTYRTVTYYPEPVAQQP